jgi:hypothetical protein
MQFPEYALAVTSVKQKYRTLLESRSQWLRCLRRRSEVACLLGLRFRIPSVYGCLSLVNAVCCQLEVYATGRSLVDGSSTECGVSEYHLETSKTRRLRPTRIIGPWGCYKKTPSVKQSTSLVSCLHSRPFITP